MQNNQPDLALSRTFKIEGGVLSAADQAEQWSQVLSLQGGASSISAGQIVDSKYRILALIGAGGMGSVYRVQHLLLGKEMALKTFSAATLTPDAWQRFQREAQAIARLTHVNIVQVFDFGIGQDNVPYYTMELLSGHTLADRLGTSGRLDLDEALPILVAVAEALAHAHRLGIVHRDIKPANIFLNQGKAGKPEVKVVDFGIAKLATSQNFDDQQQTATGFVFGSPLYMSPEQSLGDPTDQRTDIYSFGCSMFEVLTGHPPFRGNNALETLSMHHHRMPPPLVEAAGGVQFSQATEALVAKLLAKDAGRRYQTFEEVSADLRNDLLRSDTSGARRPPEMSPSDKIHPPVQSTDDNNQARTQGDKGAEGGALFKLAIIATGALVVLAMALFIPHPGTVSNKLRPTEAKFSQPPTAKAKIEITRHYSYPAAGGGTLFDFPADMVFGQIKLNDKQPQFARGKILVPRGTAVEFTPDITWQNKPELFKGFRGDDIAGLNCPSDMGKPWDNKNLEAITHYLTGLEALDLSGSDLDSTSIARLNRLKRLTGLSVIDTKLTGRDLVNLERLPYLRWLEANHLTDMREVLAKLKGNTTINNLSVNECNLADADMETIATMKSLKLLDVEDNHISITGLSSLSKLTDLRALAIRGANLRPDSIEVFQRFKNLSTLRYSTQNWSKDDRLRLHRVLPDWCNINPD